MILIILSLTNSRLFYPSFLSQKLSLRVILFRFLDFEIMTTFQANFDDFCGSCGAIIPLDADAKSECVVCKRPIDLSGKLLFYQSSFYNNFMLPSVIIGQETSYTLEFTPRGHYDQEKKAKKEAKKVQEINDDNTGQMDMTRDCSKCGHTGMSYTTMQLRSADEGQTVFYFCPKCK